MTKRGLVLAPGGHLAWTAPLAVRATSPLGSHRSKGVLVSGGSIQTDTQAQAGGGAGHKQALARPWEGQGGAAGSLEHLLLQQVLAAGTTWHPSAPTPRTHLAFLAAQAQAPA